MGTCPKFNAQNRAPARELDDAGRFLVEFYGLEQGLKIPFAEALVAFALNDLEKDRADGILGEYLQQDAGGGVAVDQHASPLQFDQGLAVTQDPGIDAFVVSVRGILELDAAFAQGVDGAIDIVRPEG